MHPLPPKILVMDDDTLVCGTARLMLQRLGYAVVLAADGEQAIEIYTQAQDSDHPVALAILDLKVDGGMGAVETARRLRDIDPEAKLVVSSGSTNLPEMVHHQQHGFQGFLAKPFLVGDVGMVVGELLD